MFAFRWYIGIMFFVSIIRAIDLSLRPYLLKIIIDDLSQFSSYNNFNYTTKFLLFYFLLMLFTASVFLLYGYFIEIKMIPSVRKKITISTFSHLLGHSTDYYQNTFSGSLSNKVNDLIYSIPEALQILIDRFFCLILAFAIAIYTLWQVQIEFALALIFWALTFSFISFFCSKKIQVLSDEWSESGSILTGKLVDALSNIVTIRLFSRQEKEKHFLNHTLQCTVHAEQKLQWFYFWMWLFYEYSFVLMQGICLYFLIKGRKENTLSIGDFALVLSLNMSIVQYLLELTKEISQFSKLLGKITQALRVTISPHDMNDKPNAKDLVLTKGEITFENVCFYYKNSKPFFENQSVIVNSGQKVGLVGYSGSGKSTFVNLILRLFDVTQGRILIDNQDIKDVTQASIRTSISMIPQETSLFHRTLMENIRYGKLEASDNDVINAAKQAHAHEFISKFHLGYDSLVGDHGVKLSGGERQRIAISRAILKDAPILILDEATSQLDSVTENHIQESLMNLMQGKTTIIIAHRLSTLLHMDRILVFSEGKIVQDGPHDKLIKKGLYKTFWNAQIGGFLPQKKLN
jgi:ATP-binding cassette, subfamily B, bacterial